MTLGSPAISTPRRALSAQDLTADIFGLRAQVQRGGVAKLVGGDAVDVCAALTSLEGWAGEVHLVGPGVDAASIDAPALVTTEGELSDATNDDSSEVGTRWVLYTSGTTGEPKPISHSLASLSRTVNANSGGELVWGLLYDPNRMAGIQVLLQGLLTDSRIVAPDLDAPLAARLAVLADEEVTALSATPSLWRQVLQVRSLDLPLQQITLGGEIADQRVLDSLASKFPGARITHVFASTETAAAFSVRDGREGFPVGYLADPPRGIRLEVRDAILHVYSPGASAAGEDGYASTGDIVEIVDDRVLFRGRASGVVNVGGTNVRPESVEAILRDHDEVIEAVVSAKPNALVGNMLIAQVTVTDDAERSDLPKRLRSWVRQRASKPFVPATVEIVDELTLSVTGKVTR